MGAVQFNKVTRGYAVTLAPAGKYPIVGDRIFYTLQAAQDYVDGNADSKTAIPGIYLSVIADGDKNGAYWVEQAAGCDGAEVGILRKMGEGGGGISSIDFTLESDTTNAVSLTINKTIKNITAEALKSSLGLKGLAYKDISDVFMEFSEGDGLSYENGVYSLVLLHNGGTYPKITYDKFGRVTSGANLTESDIPSITISKISDLSKKLEEYVLVADYDADINDKTDGLAAKVARLEQMFTFDEATGSIKTDYHFYSTKQIAGGGRPGAITNLVNVIPNYSEGVLVATINGTKIYAPASGGGVSVNPVYTSGNKVASINGVDIYIPESSGGDSITLATLATTYASGNLSAAITFAGNDSYGIFTATNNYGSIGSSSKRFYCGYINNLYAYSALYIGGTTSYFSDKTTAISASSTDYQIPSAKAVYDYCSQINRNYWYDEDPVTLTTDYKVSVNDIVVNGTCKLKTLSIPTSSGGSTYGAGSSGQVLMSNGTTVYWGTVSGGSNYTLPLASSSVRGGIKIGASNSVVAGQYVDLSVALNSSEQAYVRLSKSAVVNALGYTPAQNGSSGDPSANPILTLASINGSTTTVPNGIISVEITSAATLSMKRVTPEDPSKTCVLYLVKCGTYSVSIPVVGTSGVVAVASSGAVATSTVSLASYIGCILVWNSKNSNWVAYL